MKNVLRQRSSIVRSEIEEIISHALLQSAARIALNGDFKHLRGLF